MVAVSLKKTTRTKTPQPTEKKKNNKEEYEKTLEFDQMLEDKQKDTKIRSKLYISKSRKRIKDLLPEECNDKQCFLYREEKVWNGF